MPKSVAAVSPAALGVTGNTQSRLSNNTCIQTITLQHGSRASYALLLSSRNPILMTPLTERPLAAFTLWPAKQPSREHITERACVS